MTGLQQMAFAFVVGVNAAIGIAAVLGVALAACIVVFRPAGTTENTGAK